MAKTPASEEYVKQLQEEIARSEAEKRAITEEFTKVAKEELTPEVVRHKIRTEILPSAWVSLRDLIINGESEATRASLIKWAFEYASRPLSNQTADPDIALTNLLKELASK